MEYVLSLGPWLLYIIQLRGFCSPFAIFLPQQWCQVSRRQDCVFLFCGTAHSTHCVSCGASVGQCPDPSSSPWCRLSSSLDWTTVMQLWSGYHRIFCHGSSQWWTRRTPLLGSFSGSTTSLRSFASSTGWRLQNGLLSSVLSLYNVFTGLHHHTSSMNCVNWRTSRLV